MKILLTLLLCLMILTSCGPTKLELIQSAYKTGNITDEQLLVLLATTLDGPSSGITALTNAYLANVYSQNQYNQQAAYYYDQQQINWMNQYGLMQQMLLDQKMFNQIRWR